ncbi:N-lysine methyltransferase SMYD2-A-like [Argonauta hians]
MKGAAPGDVIYSELPYVHVVSDKELKNHCSSCLKSGSNLKQCSRCKHLKYCNTTCQKTDWSLHKQECPFFADANRERLTESIRMLLRILIRHQNGDAARIFGSDSHWQRSFSDLMSHVDGMQQTELRCHQFGHVSTVLPEFLSQNLMSASLELLWDSFGKMVINSYSIHDELHENVIGSGVYLGASYLDHSCSPNATVTFSGATLAVRAVEPIAEPLPSQVFISYIQNDAPSWERRGELLQRYYFTCTCQLCTTLAQRTDKQMTSVQCCHDNCNGFTGIKQINAEGVCDLWPCSKCLQTQFPVEFVDKVGQTWLEHRKTVKNLTNMYEKGELQKALDIAEKHLPTFSSDLLHESNLNIINTLSVAKDACISLQLWNKAADYSERVLQQVRHYPDKVNIIDSLCLLKLAKLYIHLDKPGRARQLLEQCEVRLSVSHGETSALYRHTQTLQQQCHMMMMMMGDTEDS